MGTPSNPPFPEHVFGIFCGDINAPNTQKFVQNLTLASNAGVKNVHILFQSWGGFIGDGIFLYNMLRTFPVDVTLYNGGQVASAGVLAFLGAKHRKTAKNALFMIHKSSHTGTQPATFEKLKVIQKGMILEDSRVDAIFHDNLSLPEEVLVELIHSDVNLSADDAIKYGIAQELGDFSPLIDSKVFNVLG